MARLILIEGIPGSGKTTTAKKIKEHCEINDIEVKCYQEGDLHPADLAWTSCIPIDDYNNLLVKFPELKGFDEHTSIEEDYVYIAYTRLGLTPADELVQALEKYELYGGKASFEEFRDIHLKRWKHFAETAEGNYVFECTYLQNHVVEMMLTYMLTVEETIQYMVDLLDTVKDLNPLLVYLSAKDVKKTIDHVAELRISPDKSVWKDWIELVIDYIGESNYGKDKEIGIEECYKFFEDRMKLETEIMEELNIKKLVLQVEQNWDTFEEVLLTDIEDYLNGIM